MKQITSLLLAIGLSLGSIGQSNMIKNGGFEDWTTETISETPNQWVSTENQLPGQGAISKSNEAIDGMYSLQMQSISMDEDTVFGFALLGGIGDQGPSTHVPYTDKIDSLTGWFKFDMQGNDSMTILVSQRTIGLPPTMSIQKYGGNQSSWKRFAIPLRSAVQDSIMIAFASGNAFMDYSVPGSSVQIDNIAFTTTLGSTPAAIPNYSFEEWTSTSLLNADDWYSLNAYVPPGAPLFVERSQNSHQGQYAISAQSLNFDGQIIPGIITNAPFVPGQDIRGVPYTANPEKLEFYYMYQPQLLDTASVIISFMSNNVVTSQQVYPITLSTATWTLASLNIPPMAVPDSMIIMAMSGNKEGSKLFLDDISLSGGNVGVTSWARKNKMTIYPNPSNGIVYFELPNTPDDQVIIEVYDIAGRIVFTSTIATNKFDTYHQIDLSFLEKGGYQMVIKGKLKQWRESLILN